MCIRTLQISKCDVAESIFNGDRTFEIVSKKSPIEYGDLIHYNYVAEHTYNRNPIVGRLYLVTYVETTSSDKVIGIKDVSSWSGYVHMFVRNAYGDNKKHTFRLYGSENIIVGKVTFYSGDFVTISDSDGRDFNRNIHDIIGVDENALDGRSASHGSKELLDH